MLGYFKWFWRFWSQHKVKMSCVLFLTVLTIGIKTAFPVVLKNIIDAMQGDFKVDSVLTLVWIYLFVGIIHELFSKFLPLTRAYMNLRLSTLIRRTYYNIFTQKGFNFFQHFQTGDLLTRLTDDIDGQWDRIEWYSCSGVLRPIEATLILFFSLSVMFYYSWQLTLWSFLPLPFLIMILALTQDKLVKCTQEKQLAISECNNYLETCFSGIRVIKSTLSEEEQLKTYDEILENRIQKEKNFLRINQIVHFFSLLTDHAGSLVVVFAGGYLTIQGQLELGTFLLFIIYLERLIEPIWTLSWFYASSKQVFSYVDRLQETDDFEDFERKKTPDYEKDGTPKKQQELESLEFRNVSFSYHDNTETPLLENVSFSLNSNEIVAIVGPLGAGKTTLLELVMRNLFPKEGDILINGISLPDIPSEERAKLIGYVQQESVLFSDTIENNIHLGDEILSDEVQKALETAQLSQEIEKFPYGMETKLGQRGISLSGGQKQRLSLARTLSRKPKILLLDDCTSAMDAATEARFWKAFKKNYPEMGCLVITHRSATANQADKIIHLEPGKAQEIYSWDEES